MPLLFACLLASCHTCAEDGSQPEPEPAPQASEPGRIARTARLREPSFRSLLATLEAGAPD